MNQSVFLAQLDEIISLYKSLKAQAKYDDLSGNVEIEEINTIITRAKACVYRITGPASEYYKDINTILQKRHLSEGVQLISLMGSVYALRSDLDSGYLKTLHEIIHAEVFTDYIEMAEYILSEGYKDPAAVIIGSTLEIHLKELCKVNGIPTEATNSKGKLIPKKAEVLNADLSKANVYNLAYQKQITAWFDIRNSAAHGHYHSYNAAEIKIMLLGVRQFILSNPS